MREKPHRTPPSSQLRALLRQGLHRFYSDFLLPNRTAELRGLLERALAQGYEVHSIASIWQKIKSGV
jgi:hypothetical protein